MRQRSFVLSMAVVLLLGGMAGHLWADGNVGIGTTTPDTSALLELRSTRQELLIPRLTTAQRDAIILPAKSLVIFNTTTNRFEYAAVEISSISRGFLPPRMSDSERDAIASPSKGLMVYVTTAAQEGYWYYDGISWLPLISTVSANSTIVTRYKTDDESVSNSNVLQDDDHLFVTLGSGEVWEFEGMLDFSSSSANPDVAFGLNVPTGATYKLSYRSNDGSATGFRAETGFRSDALSSGSNKVRNQAVWFSHYFCAWNRHHGQHKQYSTFAMGLYLYRCDTDNCPNEFVLEVHTNSGSST